MALTLARVMAIGAAWTGGRAALLQGQTVRGSVIAAVGGTPVANAAIVARRSATAASSDRFGRFAIPVPLRPDTLVVAAIGWIPDTVVIGSTAEPSLVVSLDRAPVVVSDLIATAPANRPLHLDDHGQWRMPIAAARTIPPAVETDIYRSLAMIPAISFSSPLSARPAIRGFDAHEATTRIDGFEVLNLYHLGRIFSSFPADATDEITVSIAPYSGANGGSVAGIIDIAGRTGRLDRFHAGGSWSFGSLSGYVGGGNDRFRYFGTGRLFYWKSLELIPKVDIPYHFEDLYAGAVFGSPDRPKGRLTLFATQDRAGKIDNASYLNWDNALLGGRWRIVDRGATSFELSGSAAQFRQNGEDVPGLHSVTNADLTNRFARFAASGDLVSLHDRSRFAAGFALGWRQVENRISDVPLSNFDIDEGLLRPAGIPRVDLSVARLELGGYLEASRQFGGLTIEGSARLDAAGSAVSIQPRLHTRWSVGSRVEVSTGLGRATRLYHVLAEPRSEPDFDFLDFWLSAGNGVPATTVDHGTIDVNVDLEPFVARMSGYASRGRGVGELKPEVDQRPSGFEFFRFGRSRGWGWEGQLAYRGSERNRRSFSVSYSFSKAERDWGGGWVPWSLDRRHQFRGFGQVRVRGFTLFAAVDVASGLPFTAVDYAFYDEGSRLVPATERRIFGRENAVSTSGTFRLDGGLAYSFGGPNRSRFTFGVSIINLLGTAVAPIGIDGSGMPAVDRAGRPTRYGRLFDLPPIPTITLRAEF